MSLPCATQTCCAVAVRGKHGDGAGVGVRANTFFANARVARRKRAVSWTSFSRTIAGRGARCLGYHGEHDKHGAECVTSDDHAYGLFGNSGGDDGGGGGDDNGDGNGNGDDCGDGPEKETKILLFTLAPAVARGWFNDDDDECTGQLTTHAEARDHTSSSAVSSYDESKDESTRTDKETNGTRMATSDEKSQNSVSIVIPALNESAQIASLLSRLRSLDPAPLEIIVAIGDSTDATEQIIKANFPDVKIVKGNRGRSSQMNAGAKVAKGKQLLFLHADTFPHHDVIGNISDAFVADSRVVCGGFVSLIETKNKTYWAMSLHNVLKTYYAPLLFAPVRFKNGLRLLFGDQAMFCDAESFWKVHGFDEHLPIMEDADLCVRLHEAGWGRCTSVTTGDVVKTVGTTKDTAVGTTNAAVGTDDTAVARTTDTAVDSNDMAVGTTFSTTTTRHELSSQGKWAALPPEKGGEEKNPKFEKTKITPLATGDGSGKIVLLNRVVHTSGRRIQGMGGNVKSTYVHALIALSWHWGADPAKMVEIYTKHYPPANG